MGVSTQEVTLEFLSCQCANCRVTQQVTGLGTPVGEEREGTNLINK